MGESQDSPHIPTDGGAIAWLIGAVGLYALATLVRAERWHQILEAAQVHARRVDCYALTTVGYMGNNVLPARAGEALRVVLLSQRSDGSKRTLLGSVVAERMLDLIALITIFVVTVYGVLSTSEVLPTDHPLVVTGVGVGLPSPRRWRSGSSAPTTSSSACATGCAPWQTRRGRC